MPEHSFFVDPGSIQAGRALLRGQVAHQIARVLRLQPGDMIDLLDNTGYRYPARIAVVRKGEVEAEIGQGERLSTEPRVVLELYQALLKGQKWDWVLQKGTEMGVSRFVPVLSERCVSRPSEAEVLRKRDRWAEIVREAAEQAGRALLPDVAPLHSFEAACQESARADLAIMAWEEERSQGIRSLIGQINVASPVVGAGRCARPNPGALDPSGEVSGRHGGPPLQPSDAGPGSEMDPMPAGPRIALLIGPEGGFAAHEADLARDLGIRVAGLGPRILRAETAALVASAVILSEMGESGG